MLTERSTAPPEAIVDGGVTIAPVTCNLAVAEGEPEPIATLPPEAMESCVVPLVTTFTLFASRVPRVAVVPKEFPPLSQTPLAPVDGKSTEAIALNVGAPVLPVGAAKKVF